MQHNFSTIILHLSLIEDIGPSVVERILAQSNDANFADIYKFSVSDFCTFYGFTSATAKKIVDGLADNQILERELFLIDRHTISWATVLDEAYPELLKNIHLPPCVIYWRGKLASSDQTFAIVGSRDANRYGQEIINKIVPVLVDNGWIIVSGGARGADTMAHQATLNAGGQTIAVLGSGLLQDLYPSSNKRLFEKIVETGGALVSPFPLLMESLPQNFPARNRVIAGMSRGCLVVQAAIKSGARITADYCLSQGREVFAIPGPIDDLLSAGCNALIQQGAKLTTGAADILIEFGQDFEPVAEAKNRLKGAESPVIQQTFIEDTSVEGIIIRTCKNPCSVDELLEATGLPLIQITKLLFDLQLKGLLAQNMAGLWEKQ